MGIEITPELLDKYNVAGPRYTSYPTAPIFHDGVSQQDVADVYASIKDDNPPLSLYIHIPFCKTMCTYCGCNVSIRKDLPEYGDKYLDYLFKEIDHVTQKLGGNPEVCQYHWGGGTPTFLNESQIERLFLKTKEAFNINFDGEVAIEVDPRTTSKSKIKLLRQLGFNRISMGVQDFDPKVGKAVNRIHTYEEIQELVDWCREEKFNSVNMDFIYGLPYQTLESFSKTLDHVVTLKPDRIALYSFAYVPWLKSHQKKIDVKTLPVPESKIEIFLESRKRLVDAGYTAIAMDHFSLADDEMTIAYSEGRLNRNFMGYTVLPSSEFISLGVTSIGFVGNGYFQHHKGLPEYYADVEAGKFPIEKGYLLTEDDIIRKWLIHSLMCRFKVEFDEFQNKFGHNFHDYFSKEKDHLEYCVSDDLLTIDDKGIYPTELGKLFVRNICMGFDAHLKQDKKNKFSQTV